MSFFPASLENLVDKFASLPGIGRKSAQRLAFHVLSLPDAEAQSFADAIISAKKSVHCCKVCQNLTEGEICQIWRKRHARQEHRVRGVRAARCAQH